MTLAAGQTRAFHAALGKLEDDHRFEWFSAEKIDEAVWRLVCEARAKPDQPGLAEAFVADHARDPITQTCFFAIDGLDAQTEVDVFGIKLLPAAALKVPDHVSALRDLVDANQVGCFAAVQVTGTSDVRMAARGRQTAEHALRLLRFTLRAPSKFRDQDLRFGIGNFWWTEGGGHQWSMPSRPQLVHLQGQLIEMATSQPVADLGVSDESKINDHARIALGWFEKAQLEDDPLSELLYLFFALEAVLGDESEGLKGEKLALRRATLGHLTIGTFRHPARTYVLYDEVRSKAVHGSKLALPVTDDAVLQFSHDIRDGINEVIQLARTRGYTKRAQLRDALDHDPARDELAAQLYADNPALWACLEPTSEAEPE
jgi:hypothetical protein